MAVDSELQDLSGALSLIVGQLIQPVEAMHRVISERVFRYLGPIGTPVHPVFDTVVGGVYGSIRVAAATVGTGAAVALASRGATAEPISGSRLGSRVQAALNAVWGDRLDDLQSDLAVSLSVRHGDRALATDRASLAAAFPDPASHIVVMLHGLGQTEQCWRSSSVDRGAGLHHSLTADATTSPVLIRYNSGLPVARTGAELAELLAALGENWPVDAPRLSLVGYSMGGLVADRAYAAGVAAGHEWASRTRDLITVATPHRGSPIARSLRLGSRALRMTRTSRPLSDFLETASAGIKDLQDGAGMADSGREIAASSRPTRRHFLAAVVTGHARHPVGVLVGDLVVRVPSATGPAVAAESVRVLSRRRHFDLLSDPEVIAQIMAWLRTAQHS